MNIRLAPPVLVITALSLSWSASALANDPVAEHLYVEGRAAAQAKDWAKACKLFQASQNREPAPGTLLNLADCEEHGGHLVTASAQYVAASRLFPSGDARATYAAERAAALAKRLAKLRVVAEASSSVECDGVLVSASTFNKFVDMDPGEHVLVVKLKGREDARLAVRLAEGERRDLDLRSTSAPETLAPKPAPSAATPPPSGGAEIASRTPPPGASTELGTSREGPSRLPAYVTLGLGAASLGVGAVTGLMAVGAANDARAACPTGRCATESDVRRADDASGSARTLALVSTIGVGAGLGTAVLGTYLLLRAPSLPVLAPSVGVGSVGVVLHGSL
jgi:hypothetical protein